MSYHLDAVTFFLYTLKHQQCCSDLHCFVLATELGSAACLLGRMHANGSTSLSVAFADGERVCVPYGNQPIFWLSTQHGQKCMGSELVMEASQVFTIQMSEKVLRLAKSKHACTD